MIKAGSLFYVIVISIIIAIVSSAIILFAYQSRLAFDFLQTQERLNLNAESGLNLLLSNQSLLAPDESRFTELYGTGEDSVYLQRKRWGAFEFVLSRAVFHNRMVERLAQAGYASDVSKPYALYLADEGKPLALCGDTKITGNAFLPKSGVERAYIEGQHFTGKQLINGTIYKSDNLLPALNKDLLDHLQKLLKEKKQTDTDSVITMNRAFSGDSLHHTFKENTLILKSHGPVYVDNTTYSGNIILLSDTVILVGSNAQLEDVILIAPRIIIQEHFRGQLQAFCSDSLIVEPNVTLRYPSVLGLVSFNASRPCAIVLNENDTLIGSVFAHQTLIDSYKRAGIRLRKKSVLIGQAYSSGYAEVQGSIYGSLTCSKLLLETPSSVYENHLLNATINQMALPSYFTGITLFQETAYKKVVKWLN